MFVKCFKYFFTTVLYKAWVYNILFNINHHLYSQLLHFSFLTRFVQRLRSIVYKLVPT